MPEQTIMHMIQNSHGILPILFLVSIIVTAFALERFWSIFLLNRLPSGVWSKVRNELQRGNRMGAADACRKGDHPVIEAFSRILALNNPSTEQIVEVFQLYRQRFHMSLNRRLGFFGTVSFISPLIGLTGTVLGIMTSFHDLAKAGAGGPAVVAAGISEALTTTAAGIGVAVVSAVCYNYFTLSVRHRMSVVDLWVLELADLMQRTSPAPQPQAIPPQYSQQQQYQQQGQSPFQQARVTMPYKP